MIIDSDYYNNPNNEGEIFFQVINLAPFAIQLKRGDKIGQGIFHHYLLTEDDQATGERTGGFGSTSNQCAVSPQEIAEGLRHAQSLRSNLGTVDEDMSQFVRKSMEGLAAAREKAGEASE